MADALDMVKKHFGGDAVILNTRSIERRGVLSGRHRPNVEITAARAFADLPEPLRSCGLEITRGRDDRILATKLTTNPAVPSTAGVVDSAGVILSEVNALRDLVGELVDRSRRTDAHDVPPALRGPYVELVKNAVAEDLARQLVEGVVNSLSASEWTDSRAVRAKLLESLSAMIPVAGDIALDERSRPAVIALIGPTGVGKTTTIAKLAAEFSLRRKKSVALITIDTYRIAAVDQLRTYAQIMGIQLTVAGSPAEFREAVQAASCHDVVLIDTAGRSQRDKGKLSELKAYFDACRPDEVHLALSGAAGERVLLQTIEKFRPVGFNRILFTKLDEAIGFGVILSCLRKVEARLSYVTTGQDVPRDILLGKSESLAALILNTARQSAEPVAAD